MLTFIMIEILRNDEGRSVRFGKKGKIEEMKMKIHKSLHKISGIGIEVTLERSRDFVQGQCWTGRCN